MGAIAEAEAKLFHAFQKENPDIVTDGVVDETEFLAARYRIVYILKEVNGGKGWDLREFVHMGGRAQTWDNIARWTEAILQWEKDFLWEDMEKNNELRRNTVLKKIAAVNIKKTSGGHTSDAKQIGQAAIANRTILQKQLALYQPDFVICCGTEKAFLDACYPEREIDWKMTKRGVWYFRDNDRIVVSFAHPEARVKDAYLFYALADAIREIQEKSDKPETEL